MATNPTTITVLDCRSSGRPPVWPRANLTIACKGRTAYLYAEGARCRQRVDGFARQVCRTHRSPSDALRVLANTMRSHRIDAAAVLGWDAFLAAVKSCGGS